MENFMIATSANQLNKIFDSATDKLVILMYYTKSNPDCRKARQYFEKFSMNHAISIFCIVDMDKFEGESRFVNNVSNMPKFECFHQGNSFGSGSTSDEKNIESLIRSAEQYVMTQNNMKNNNIMGQQNMQMMGMNQPQYNIAQIQQQILNTAMTQNPALAQQLMQNPMMLQQLAQKQIQMMQNQYLQQQPMMQTQQMPMMSQMNTYAPNMAPNMTTNMAPNNIFTQMPGIQGNTFPQQQTNTPINTTAQIPVANTSTINNNILPTFQQMQQMFQIFQMMQKMGILNTTDTGNVSDLLNSTTEKTTTPDADNIITLPTGEKIIPLPNGKYGLIKK